MTPGQSRADAAIALLWSTYTGPLFWAALELIVAGRTDEELRPALTSLQEEVGRTLARPFAREMEQAGEASV